MRFTRCGLSIVSLVIVTALLFTGCAQTAGGRRAQTQGTALGAVLGGLAGVALGAATGNRNAMIAGALIGATAGGAAGYAYGTHKARKIDAYANREAWLDACIADARATNQRAYALNKGLERRVAALESRARSAGGNKAARRKLKADIAKIRNEIGASQKDLDAEIALQNQYASQSSARSAQNYALMRKEAAALTQNKAQSGRYLGRLAGVENQLDR